ncbi:putative F-box associated interaction domain-containing protein [Rosa chinensis]|uniref:Putative F-box associated interaction domain-containing protein n=1 Tax=Rosa chinensis TaxID=74649 RepID=A0A2P6Q8D0_ROSCH|nr:putative F-box associated interaction domain-containing protein [Rosa chinensis]
MELPKPGFSDGLWLRYYGAGYLSATDDYKVFAASYDVNGPTREMKMFSLRAHVWKTIQHPGHDKASDEGSLLNDEAIHWSVGNEILAFDFEQEEFRTVCLPDHHDIQDPFGVSYVGVSEGCLCVCGHRRGVYIYKSVDFWVMREYDVCDSWTKLFNLSYPPGVLYTYFLIGYGKQISCRKRGWRRVVVG